MTNFLKEIKNPPAEYKGMPFWSWNGKLDKAEIKRQVPLFKEMGFGGFFIHSRVGIETEYLGKEWFDCIEIAVEEAAKHGLIVYIYDEDRWPSGSCGGMATMIPKCRQKSLTVKLTSAEKFSYSDYGQELVRVFAIKFDGGILTDYFAYDVPEEIPENYQLAVFSTIEMAPQNFYNGYTYLDTLNIEATEYFIKLTHEKYKERFGALFGNKIVGFFTDEVHHGTVFNGFNLTNEERLSMCPWTYKLFDTFKKSHGYRLEDNLPELFFKGKELFSKVAYDYNITVQQMFLDNFVKPYYKWCEDNNLILTGHILHEDCLGAQAACCGSAARTYEYMHIPGVDVLGDNNKNYWIAKQGVSVSRQMGYKRTLSELYGVSGWDFTFEGHRNVGAWQAVQGINFRCHHLSWYTMKGEAKRDYPASIFYQSAWYKDYKRIEDTFTRIGYITSNCQPVCDTAVITPIESLYGLVHLGWINYFDPIEKEGVEIEKLYADTYRKFAYNAIDFDYIDEDILARRHVKVKDNTLGVGKAKYKKIVVRGLLNIRSTTLNALNAFAERGGKVYWVGKLPEYVDGKKAVVSPKGIIIDNLSDKIIEEIKDDIVTVNANGAVMKGLYKKGEDLFAIILNEDLKKTIERVEIMAKGEYSVQELVAETGEINGVLYAQNGGITRTDTRLSAGEIKVYVFTKAFEESLPVQEKKYKEIIAPTEFDYTLSEDNVCVLDSAICEYGGVKTDKKEVLKIETEIREKIGACRKNGDMLQPWFLNKFFKEERNEVDILLRFPFTVKNLPKRVDLVIEEPDARIIINGNELKAERKNEIWVDSCFAVYPLDTDLLKFGKNEITLSYRYHDRRNIEAIYLKGDFGVVVKGAEVEICNLPEKLKIGDICEQGLPFYSAKLTYRINLDDGKYRVKLPKTYAAVNYLRSNDNQKMVAYPPYKGEITVKDELDIDCIFTRRNTFGPLHHYPKHRGICGAEHFYTTGEQYIADYQVIEQGLLEPVLIEREEND